MAVVGGGGSGGGAAAVADAARKRRPKAGSGAEDTETTRRRARRVEKARRIHAHDLAERQKTPLGRFSLTMHQPAVRRLYLNPNVQVFIAVLIVGNFLSNIVEKQIDPQGTRFRSNWFLLETFWNIVFIIELIWNMYGCFYLTQWNGNFFNSGWNLFDFTVVAVSIPLMTGTDLGPVFGQLRMLRAFRVFRLFKRVKSLNKIIVSLGHAVPGILNAALVQLIVMCIYAILGVDLFSNLGKNEDGNMLNIDDTNFTIITSRGLTYGEEYYGNFFRSLYTLFQVLTGESWSEVIARPAIFGKDIEWRSAMFYVSFVILCGIVLVNVAVAVLLEKMVDTEPPPEDDDDLSEASPPLQGEQLTNDPNSSEVKPCGFVTTTATIGEIGTGPLEELRRELAALREHTYQREDALLRAIEDLAAKVDESREEARRVTDIAQRRSRKRLGPPRNGGSAGVIGSSAQAEVVAAGGGGRGRDSVSPDDSPNRARSSTSTELGRSPARSSRNRPCSSAAGDMNHRAEHGHATLTSDDEDVAQDGERSMTKGRPIRRPHRSHGTGSHLHA